jgi:3-oxoacyl-[acyl-carrier protein] reductase
MLDLTGETALVFGAASGIGAGVVRTLAALGAQVVAADIDGVRLRRVAAEITAGNATVREIDVADAIATSRLIDDVVHEYGALDILVNSAAVTRYLDFLDVTPGDWDWMEGINLRGLFFVTQAAARQMASQGGGRIVNISSIAGKDRHSSNAVYACTKGAIITLGRNAAARFGPHNVTVNTVCPGITLTPLVERNARLRAEQRRISPDEHLAEIASRSALGRINTVEDVANAVAFLVSPMARNITGQSLNVDGGVVWD